MVKVRGGMPSEAKRKKAKVYSSHLSLFDYKGVMLSHSTSSKIESGIYINVLSAVARQCTVYRTVFTKTPQDEQQAKKRLLRWAKLLPVKLIR